MKKNLDSVLETFHMDSSDMGQIIQETLNDEFEEYKKQKLEPYGYFNLSHSQQRRYHLFDILMTLTIASSCIFMTLATKNFIFAMLFISYYITCLCGFKPVHKTFRFFHYWKYKREFLKKLNEDDSLDLQVSFYEEYVTGKIQDFFDRNISGMGQNIQKAREVEDRSTETLNELYKHQDVFQKYNAIGYEETKIKLKRDIEESSEFKKDLKIKLQEIKEKKESILNTFDTKKNTDLEITKLREAEKFAKSVSHKLNLNLVDLYELDHVQKVIIPAIMQVIDTKLVAMIDDVRIEIEAKKEATSMLI